MNINHKKKENLQQVQLIAHKEILSFREALQYMDVSQSFLYKLTSKKAIEFTKPNGGKIYFRKSDLDNWMLQNESGSARVLQTEVYNHLKKNKR
ncbi:helix-turn-helix domain-containing protein [Muricauda sp. HICW]|uniref:Helix-turn-helix domain-containing protein n=1 Tax=Flagellimonas chongwuensis TaxID=2697365 RepID=A0A850NK38_9FLAO|nr:helix-turn-helix domain-containing protein [Allomuricauda chongwuensis]NVN19450.1 helix-turn-helix domain-containing protein [Allomuricauda chongwuensis]